MPAWHWPWAPPLLQPHRLLDLMMTTTVIVISNGHTLRPSCSSAKLPSKSGSRTRRVSLPAFLQTGTSRIRAQAARHDHSALAPRRSACLSAPPTRRTVHQAHANGTSRLEPSSRAICPTDHSTLPAGKVLRIPALRARFCPGSWGFGRLPCASALHERKRRRRRLPSICRLRVALRGRCTGDIDSALSLRQPGAPFQHPSNGTSAALRGSAHGANGLLCRIPLAAGTTKARAREQERHKSPLERLSPARPFDPSPR